MIFGRLEPDDPGALRLSTQAGWNQTSDDWRRVVALAGEGAFAGRVDGRLAATATVVRYDPGVAWIGMVLVDEAFRGRGYGTAILRRAVDHARATVGDAFGLDATDLGRPLYLKMGFVDVAPIDRWTGVLREGRSAAERLDAVDDALLRADRAACGADRGALLQSLPPTAWRTRGGHAFLRPGRAAAHLGPLVAAGPDDLSALLGAAARERRGGAVVVDAFRRHGIPEALGAAGLQVARRLTRMTWARPQVLLDGPGACAATAFEWG